MIQRTRVHRNDLQRVSQCHGLPMRSPHDSCCKCPSQVFDDLQEEGHFYDPLTKEVKDVFLPWLMDEVVQEVDKAVESMAIVDGELRKEGRDDVVSTTH